MTLPPLTPFVVAQLRASIRMPTCPGWAKLDAPPCIAPDPGDGGWLLLLHGHIHARSLDPEPLLLLAAGEAASRGFASEILDPRLDVETVCLDPSARLDALRAREAEHAAFRAKREAEATEAASSRRADRITSLDDLFALPTRTPSENLK